MIITPVARCVILGALPLLLSNARNSYCQDKPDLVKLLTVGKGDLPIIVSAPHGGRSPLPEVPERKGIGINKFATVRDDNTAELAEKLAAAIEKQFNAKPHLVIARFERKYLDVNRPSEGAYESDKAKHFYDAYHAALHDASRLVKREWGYGIIIDLHGQAADADAVFRGTKGGQSVKLLSERFGKPALTGEKSLLGQLAKKNWKVLPANDTNDPEDKRFNGGYIVQTYGSHQMFGIDAIQLELGGNLRAKNRLDRTAAEIAEALKVFTKEYLPGEKLPMKK